MKLLRYYAKDISIMLVLLGLACLFFFDVLFQGKTLFTGDYISLNIPGKFLLKHLIENKEIPFWNPYLFSGMPFLADVNFGVLAPLNILYFWFNPFVAHNLNVVFAIWFTGVGMYLYCRIIRFSKFSSLVSAIIYMFSGSVMINTLNTAILNVVMWIPIILWSVELYFYKKTLKFSLLISTFLSLQFLSGHIQYSYYTWLFIFVYLIWKIKPFNAVAILKKTLLIFIPVLLLTAIQLLPFLEYSQFTTRPQQSLHFAAGSTSILSFIRLIIPNFFGVLNKGTSWGATADISGFIGIIPLFMVIFFAFRTKQSLNRFYLLIAIITLLISLGRYSPVFVLLYYILPFYSRFRSPGTILIIYTFSLCIVSGYAISYIFLQKNKKKILPIVINSLFITIPLIIISFLSKFFGFSVFIKFLHFAQQVRQTTFITRFLEYSAVRMHTIYTLWMNNILLDLFFLTLFLLIVYFVYRQKQFLFFHKVIIVLLIATELMYYAGTIHISAKEDLLEPSPYINKVLKKDTSHFRIYTLKDEPKKPVFGDPNYFIDEAVKSMTFMQPDSNIFYGTQSIDGYTSMVYKPYADFVMKKPPTDPTGIEIINPLNTILDELNVKYVLTAGRFFQELEKSTKYSLVYSYFHPFLKRSFYVFENSQVKSRVEIVDNTKATASIVSYEPNQIIIKTVTDSTSTLLLRDVYYPGWSATVNNIKVPIKQSQIFRSVEVPKGVSHVRFLFNPLSYVISSWISLISWISIITYLLLSFFKQQKKIRTKLHISKSKIKE